MHLNHVKNKMNFCFIPTKNFDKKRKKHIQESWNFSLYNVYGRENAYQINFQDDPKDLSRTQIIQTSLFRWVPSVTYQFKF